jgi:type IV pilus assembly protein PilC
MFCKKLHMFARAGVTFADGLMIMCDDEPGADGKALLRAISDALDGGEPLSASLRETACFPEYLINSVHVGELTGRLPETLSALSLYYENQDSLKKAVKSAVLYPAAVLVLMVAVVLILIVKVLPIFNEVYAQLGAQMPPLAERLMRIGGWLEGASVVIAVGLCAVFALSFASWAIPSVRKRLAETLGNIFGERGIFADIATARFTSAMALCLASGCLSDKAVEIASAVSGGAKSIDVRNNECLGFVLAGKSISESMRLSGILSAGEARLLSLGGKNGALDATMADIAQRAEQAVREGMQHIVSIIEPAIVIATSVLIGVILFSVMMPLMSIMTSIG